MQIVIVSAIKFENRVICNDFLEIRLVIKFLALACEYNYLKKFPLQ